MACAGKAGAVAGRTAVDSQLGLHPSPSVPTTATGRGQQPASVRLQPVAARRRPAVAAVSALVVVVCTAVVGVSFSHAGHTTAVLAVAKAVAPGAVIDSSDLQVVDVHVPAGVPAVPASDEPDVVGRQAGELLQQGALLVPSDTVAAYAPSQGMAEVGVAVAASQIPAGGVAPGQQVEVVVTGAPGSTSASSIASNDAAVGSSGGSGAEAPGTVVVQSAPVVSVSVPTVQSSTTSDVVVSILVPVSEAPVVAALSAAGDGALVVMAPPL